MNGTGASLSAARVDKVTRDSANASNPPATTTTPSTAAHRKMLAQRDVELLSVLLAMLDTRHSSRLPLKLALFSPPLTRSCAYIHSPASSLPARDQAAYYDDASPCTSDSELSDDGARDAEYDLARPTTLSAIPTTNRGHKLSRLAPHTRRGRLGYYPHADAGFDDGPLMSAGGDLSAGAREPAHKRRKLNDVAPSATEAGFPVAPNLQLVPRPVHALSRESDRPAPSYLPPVPQSPLDLLLMPSVQYSLGKKNQTFHLLGASATALIEQEAQLINALGKVCRGLRGEGYEWRWQGDDGRRQAKKEAKEESERKRAGALAAAAAPAENAQPAAPDAPPADPAPTDSQVGADPTPNVSAPASTSAAATPAVADLQAENVKAEQATPVLQSATAPVSATPVEHPVEVPGVSASAPEATASTSEDVEMKSSEPAVPAQAEAAAPVAAPAAPSGVAAVLAQGTESGAGGSAPPSVTGTVAGPANSPSEGGGAAAAARSSAPPSTATTVEGIDVPVSTSGEAAKDPEAAAEPTASTSNGTVAATLNGEAAGPAAAEADGTDASAAMEVDESVTADGTPAPSTAGGDDVATAAVRRRSGRVPAGGRGAMRHTRSRQSSPEDEGAFSSGAEDDAAFYDDEALDGVRTTAARRNGLGGGSAGARAQLIPEEELPEYAERMVDPEGYVRSLFVTEGEKVELERMVPAPGGGAMPSGQFDS